MCFIPMKISQSYVLGYQGWVETLMITLVSSQNSLKPSISSPSVTTSPLSDAYVSRKTQLQAINLNFRALDNVVSWMFAVTSYKTE